MKKYRINYRSIIVAVLIIFSTFNLVGIIPVSEKYRSIFIFTSLILVQVVNFYKKNEKV